MSGGIETISCSVVIPTSGRSTLSRAVASALAQRGVDVEVIVVTNGDNPPALSDLGSGVRVLHSPGPSVNRSRQRGIEAARGDVVALLDDDDEWEPAKLATQWAAVRDCGDEWIASCALVDVRDGHQTATRPSDGGHVISAPADYLFRRRSRRLPGHQLQTSTLVFPRTLGMRVPWSENVPLHQDWAWVIAASRSTPGLTIVQVPEMLVRREVGATAGSITARSRWRESVAWAAEFLADAGRRTRGDFLLGISFAIAQREGSLAGMRAVLWRSITTGAPSFWYLADRGLAVTRAHLARLRRSTP